MRLTDIDTILIIPVSMGYRYLKPSILYDVLYPDAHVLNAKGSEVLKDFTKDVKIKLYPPLEKRSAVIISNELDGLSDAIIECKNVCTNIVDLALIPYVCNWYSGVDWDEFSYKLGLNLGYTNEKYIHTAAPSSVFMGECG